jgi:FkbM family methyltransferase
MIQNEISFLLKKFKVDVKGVFHVGAHECEEYPTYLNFTPNITWVEALPSLIEKSLTKHPELNIISAVVSDKDDQVVEFNITNNTKCSSMLDLDYHKEIHPEVVVEKQITLKTKTIQTIYLENNIGEADNNFLVLDIQGAELLALKGMGNILDNIDAIYIEATERPLYEGGCVLEDLDNFLFKLGYTRKYLMLLNSYGNAFYLKTKTV